MDCPHRCWLDPLALSLLVLSLMVIESNPGIPVTLPWLGKSPEIALQATMQINGNSQCTADKEK
jgi:hypothetical protein